MFSMGLVDITAAHYQVLPEGRYTFHAASFDIFGQPAGPAASISVLVPPPFWRTPWFWSFVVTSLVVFVLAGGRYLVWHRMRHEMAQLKNQQALEQERLRIAQDIHDDLGARVTEISLASALAKSKANFPAGASADFDNISTMSRDLVAALYETVWAVNPENDNLDALGNFLCQTINHLCKQAQLLCRFEISDLPANFQVSSHTRHNIVMAVKEAVHNVIKHAHATEITLHVTFERGVLSVSVQDNGCGIKAGGGPPGDGLNNMKRRLEILGGTCSIESQPNHGTTVQMLVSLRSTP
jgi:signal transduction histidine kinase